MPKIPQYTRQGSIPGVSGDVRMSPEALTAPARELQGLGAELGRISEDISRRQEALRKQDELNFMFEAVNGFSNAYREFETEEIQKTGKDTYGNTERAQKFIEAQIQELIKDAPSQEVAAAIRQKVLTITQSSLDKLSIKQAVERKNVHISTLNEMTEGFRKDAFADPNSVDEYFTELSDAYAQAIETGMMSQDEAEERLLEAQQAIYADALNGIIERDPKEALERIRKGEFDSKLSQDQIKQARDLAKKIEEDKKKEFELIKARAEKQEEEALKALQEETELSFLDKHLAETLTIQEIRDSSLPVTRKEHWIKQVEARAKGKAEKSDPAIFNRLVQEIYEDPNKYTPAEIAAYAGKGLTGDDAKELANQLRTLQKEGSTESDPARKKSISQVLKNFDLDMKAGMFGDYDDDSKTPSVDASIELAKQQRDFLNWVKRNPEADPIEYYEKIMEPRKRTLMEEIIDWIPFVNPPEEPREPVERRREILLKEKGISWEDVEFTAKKHRITVEEVLKRLEID